jgi:hypothetical protein
VINRTNRGEEDLQQVANTSLHSENTRPRQIRAKPPRSNLQASVCRCPDNLDLLVQASDSQSRLVVLLASRQTLPLSIRVVARDVNIAAVDGTVVPLGLDDVVVCDQHAANDGEDDEEDASAGVLAGGGGRPLAREERRAMVVGEGHRHTAGRGGGVHVHA